MTSWVPISPPTPVWSSDALPIVVFDPNVFAAFPVFDTGTGFWTKQTTPSNVWTEQI